MNPQALSSTSRFPHSLRIPAAFAVVVLSFQSLRAEEKGEVDPAVAVERAETAAPSTVEEARGRARWMHEMMHGALQVMHRDFFGDGDEESLSLPSQSLDDVFEEMSRSWNVEIRWLAVNAGKGINHKPKDRFEEAAAKALEEGAEEFEQVEKNRFRYVGVIHIQNQCLKCHDRNRTSLDAKVAGLAFSLPLQATASKETE
jgi:hypothetical protein